MIKGTALCSILVRSFLRSWGRGLGYEIYEAKMWYRPTSPPKPGTKMMQGLCGFLVMSIVLKTPKPSSRPLY